MTNTMPILKRLVLLALFVLVGSVPAFAQTATTSTTLSTAITDNTRTVVIAVATSADVGGRLYIDQESMDITGVNSTTISVSRGAHGTAAQNHAVSALVYVVARATVANVFTGKRRTVTCTATSEAFLPQIDEVSGDIWYCNSSVWTAVNWGRISYNIGRTAVLNAAYTVLPTDYLVAMTSLSTARTFTLPVPTLTSGKTFIFIDESGLASTSNTITISGQFQTSTSALVINAAFGSVRIYSNGSRYFQF